MLSTHTTEICKFLKYKIEKKHRSCFSAPCSVWEFWYLIENFESGFDSNRKLLREFASIFPYLYYEVYEYI